jgi:hypothetical protein
MQASCMIVAARKPVLPQGVVNLQPIWIPTLVGMIVREDAARRFPIRGA